MIVAPEIFLTMLLAICTLVVFDLFFTYKLYTSVENSDQEWVREVETKISDLVRSVSILEDALAKVMEDEEKRKDRIVEQHERKD